MEKHRRCLLKFNTWRYFEVETLEHLFPDAFPLYPARYTAPWKENRCSRHLRIIARSGLSNELPFLYRFFSQPSVSSEAWVCLAWILSCIFHDSRLGWAFRALRTDEHRGDRGTRFDRRFILQTTGIKMRATTRPDDKLLSPGDDDAGKKTAFFAHGGFPAGNTHRTNMIHKSGASTMLTPRGWITRGRRGRIVPGALFRETFAFVAQIKRRIKQ